MSSNEHFLEATNKKFNTKRMKDQEACLRFLSYRRLLEDRKLHKHKKINPTTLMSDTNKELSERKYELRELERYKDFFSISMRNATYLFGRKAFRRYLPSELSSDKAHSINIQLFTIWAVILSYVSTDEFREVGIHKGSFTRHLAEALDQNEEFSVLLDYWVPENTLPLFQKCAELLERRIGKKLFDEGSFS